MCHSHLPSQACSAEQTLILLYWKSLSSGNLSQPSKLWSDLCEKNKSYVRISSQTLISTEYIYSCSAFCVNSSLLFTISSDHWQQHAKLLFLCSSFFYRIILFGICSHLPRYFFSRWLSACRQIWRPRIHNRGFEVCT